MRIALLTALTLLLLAAAAAARTPQPFPDLALSGTVTDEQRAYLGVDTGRFTLSQIKADYLFIEAYSMYCPICQRDAPHLNELYRRLTEADPEGRIRMIGLGLGNTQFETTFYREKFAVPFPLFDDGDYAVHKALGEPVAPTYYIVRLDPDGAEILYEWEGELEKDIFDTIMTLTGGR
jgi:thiol-disulfide isomerase/thioredoxin